MRALSAATAAVAVLMMTFAMAADELVWRDLFAPPYSTLPEMAFDIACISRDQCYIPGGSNGVGFGIYSFDGKTNGYLNMMNEPNMTMMIMTMAAGGTAAKPNAAFGGFGMLTVSRALQYLSNGSTWLPSTIPAEFIWVTQSMRATDDGKHIISLGTGPGGNSIMHSADAGQTFNLISLASLPLLSKECTAVSYAAMVDANTWYITMGSTPPQNNGGSSSGGSGGSSSMGGKISANDMKRGGRFGRTAAEQRALHPLHKGSADTNCTYSGQIAVTRDAGKTWTVLYNTTEITFDQIDCISDTHCVTVGFGLDNGAPVTKILTMTDGKTWTTTLRLLSETDSLFAVRFADAQEVWVAGSSVTQTSGAGIFYYSKNGGVTWTKYSMMIPNIMMIMGMDFTKDGVGFAVGMTMLKTATVLRYEKQSFSGYFTQSNCPVAGCSFLCENMTFAQGMCLQTQGGSASVSCSATELVQKVYETTSCIGSYTTATMPINQCLNSTNGGFFINYCNTTATSETKQTKSRKFLGLF